jgi:NitT/TauT family transport system permease protein
MANERPEDREDRLRNLVHTLRILLPAAIGAALLGLWEYYVQANSVPAYILPAPSAIIDTLWKDWGPLSSGLLITLRITVISLAIAIAAGTLLAILFAQSKILELSLFPYAVILQVTPIVAVAPLILIYVDDTTAAVLICAAIVAFFPILSNTTLGLNSADHNLINLFQLYGATRWQTLLFLRLPSALPYILGGLRIAGGLALIGAVVAEFAAGAGGTGSGLAYRILEAGYRLNIPRMFAALILIAMAGILIFAIFTLISHLALRRWHESALKREN